MKDLYGLINDVVIMGKEDELVFLMQSLFKLFVKKSQKIWTSETIDNLCLNYDDLFSISSYYIFQNMKNIKKNVKIDPRLFISKYLFFMRNIFINNIKRSHQAKQFILTNSYNDADPKSYQNLVLDETNRIKELESQERFTRILKCVNQAQRKILILKLRGLSFKEISEELNIPQNHIIYLFYKIKKNKKAYNIFIENK